MLLVQVTVRLRLQLLMRQPLQLQPAGIPTFGATYGHRIIHEEEHLLVQRQRLKGGTK